MNQAILEQIMKDLAKGVPGVLCTVVDVEGSTPRNVGASMWVRPDGGISGTVGGGVFEHHTIREALSLLDSERDHALYKEGLHCDGSDPNSAACGGDISVFLEVVGRERELVIFGAGHVGKALAQAGQFAGFRVSVWDEREEFANAENIPWGTTIACPLEEIFDRGLKLHGRSFVVIATRGHALDSEVVKTIEHCDAAYVGMIGSMRKIAFVRKRLLDEGVSEAHLNRIYQPVGLPIRAETPEEIAISVVAELIAVLRKGDLSSLRKGLNGGNTPTTRE